MNLSKKCSDLSLSPLKIGGGTPDNDLLPLAVLFSAGGMGAVTVAAISSISTWGVAAISSIGAVAISVVGLVLLLGTSYVSRSGIAGLFLSNFLVGRNFRLRFVQRALYTT